MLSLRRKLNVRRGQALITAIMVLTVLAAAAIALSAGARLEVRAARRGVDQVQQEAALRGAVNRGIALLDGARQDPEGLRSLLRKHHELRWMPFDPDAEPDQPGLEVAIQVLDASARLNLNYAEGDQLRKLPGIDKDAVESILSWRNRRSRDKYDQGSRPYDPKRRPFDSVEELLLVHDVDAAQFFGGPSPREVAERRTPPLSEWLSAWSGEENVDSQGDARINVNTAGEAELLESANRVEQAVTPEQVQMLIQKRTERRSGGTGDGATAPDFKSVSEALREAGVEEKRWGQALDAWTADSREFLPGRINVNTAPPAILAAIPGMNEGLAERLVERRDARPGGLTWTDLLDTLASTGPDSDGGGTPQPPPGEEQPAPEQPNQNQAQGQGPDQLERFFCLRSSVYLVRVLVREVGSARTSAACAVVQWRSGSPGIVQWREPDRFPGWSAWHRPLSDDERGGGGR